MTREDAEALVDTLSQRRDITSYAKHIPGFWQAWIAGDLARAVELLRGFLREMARPGLNAQPEIAKILAERLDAIVGRDESSAG